jgi:hypothetical protein
MTIYAMVGTVGGALFGAMPAGGTTQTALGGSRFFVNAERTWERMKALGDKMEPKSKVVAVGVSRVPDLEYTALKMLIDSEKRERNRGGVSMVGGAQPRRAICDSAIAAR